MVPKKDGTHRLCVDYRKLDKLTKLDLCLLPLIEDILHADQACGYWQIALEKSYMDKSVFITHDGLFEFEVLPFGLTNAHSTYQRLMDYVLRDLQWKICFV